ncbi:DUF4956 domain-containing protein [Candidatus Saccharibacteria bacterium]|nr:DUF4956 domain-containing protein [Candidatus Saccharibacteria bacterium]
MFNSIFDWTTNGLDITSILICSGVGILLGLVIAFTHMKTTRTTKNFLVTLAVLPILVQVVMLMVNGSLGTSIAILGAFSLIRFRSIAGNSKEILSVFFSMAIGLALGMGQILFASIITILVALVIFVLSVTKLLEPARKDQILKITIPEDLDYDDALDDIFKKYTKGYSLVKTKTIDMGSLYKLTYSVTLKGGVKEKEMIDAIRERNCNMQVALSRPNMDGEI